MHLVQNHHPDVVQPTVTDTPKLSYRRTRARRVRSFLPRGLRVEHVAQDLSRHYDDVGIRGVDVHVSRLQPDPSHPEQRLELPQLLVGQSLERSCVYGLLPSR